MTHCQDKDDKGCSIIIPAHNEENYIENCLRALLMQSPDTGTAQIIVIANGCKDRTACIARGFEFQAKGRGWRLDVIEIKRGNKTVALNVGDRCAEYPTKIYIDADILCEPTLIKKMKEVAVRPEPVYVTGTLKLAPTQSMVSRLYGSFWILLPFISGGAVGAGCYAVNGSGRMRWDEFPEIISDDSFARLQFKQRERVEIDSSYQWPISEGLVALVRVRKRQDVGMRELFHRFPNLRQNESKQPLGAVYLAKCFFKRPFGGIIYIFISIVVRLMPTPKNWSTGRN